MTLKEHIQALIDCDFIDTVPDALPVGYFADNKKIVFPNFNGKPTRNICFIENEYNKNSICLQLEYIAISLMAQVSPNLTKLTIIDFGHTLSFKNINQISNLYNNVQLLRNPNELSDLIFKLEGRVKEIQSKYLTNKYSEINDFNSIAAFNKAHFEFVFFVDFPKGIETINQFESIKNLIKYQSFCGVYFYTLFNDKNISNVLIEHLSRKNYNYINEFDNLLESMITIDSSKGNLDLNQVRISKLNEKNTTFSLFPFQQLNFDSLISLIKAKYEKEESNSNLDFIEIPIGYEGNNEVSIKLGDKSNITGVAICGSKGSGKSTFLTNFVANTILKYSPNHVRFLILDYTDNEEFDVFENSPNVELLSLNKKKWEVGFNKMREIIDANIAIRIKEFKEASNQVNKKVNNLSQYFWATNKTLPVYIILIDEGAKLVQRGGKAISEEAPKLVNDYLAKVLEEYRKFGIYLIFATQSYKELSFKALSEIDLRIGFRVATNADCSDLFKGKRPVGLQKYYALFNDNFGHDDEVGSITKTLKMFDLIENMQTNLKENTQKYLNLDFERYILRYSPKNDFDETPTAETPKLSVLQRRQNSLKNI